MGQAPHRTTIRVRFGELDPYNHVNHAVYISYFETARVELLAAAGLSLGELRRRGRSIIVSEIRTKFLASAEERNELTVETEILDIKRVTSTWRQRIFRDETLIAEQQIRVAVLNDSGRPVAFDAIEREALHPYLVEE